MSAPASGSTVTQVISGAPNTTQATAEASFNTAYAAIVPKAGTPVFLNFFSYSIVWNGQAPLFTVSGVVTFIAP